VLPARSVLPNAMECTPSLEIVKGPVYAAGEPLSSFGVRGSYIGWSIGVDRVERDRHRAGIPAVCSLLFSVNSLEL